MDIGWAVLRKETGGNAVFTCKKTNPHRIKATKDASTKYLGG